MLTNRLARVAFILASLPLAVASAAAAPDTIRDGLEKAKAARVDERAKAKSAFIASIDALIKAAGSAGDLDGLKTLTAQKDAFASTGVLPNLPSLKDAAGQYTQALRKADGGLVAAYEVAIQGYTDAQKTAEADALRRERQQLLNGAAAPADSPEAFALILDRAKADYQTTINDGRKAYVQSIASRADAAARSGDLNAVTRFKAAQAAAEADQPLPEGMNDATVIGARVRFNNTIQGANVRLAQVYRDTIRGLTRANKIDQATAVQSEFDATGLSGAPAGNTGAARATGGANADNRNNLARTLPAYLVATGPFGAEKEGGIKPADKCVIATNASDYLSKDFIFDVSVVVPKENHGITVGIGDFSHKGSLRIAIYEDGGWGRLAHLAIGEEWGKKMGKIHTGETIVVRIERHDGPITASIGAITDGKFVAEFSQTIADPKKAMPELSERRAKLFFTGEARFTQVRLATGAAAKDDAGASAVVGPGMGIAKITPSKISAVGSTPAPAVAPEVKPPEVAVTPPVTPPVVTPPVLPPVTPPMIGKPTPPKATTPPATPPAVAPATKTTTPPTATPPANNPDLAGIAAAIPARIAAADLIEVGTLESKKAPIGKDLPGRLVFTAPPHDKTWKGANGVAIPAGSAWEKVGTVWICDELHIKPRGATFIHPFGDGQVQIHIGEDGIAMSTNGKWDTYKEFTKQPLLTSAKITLPLSREKKYRTRTEVRPDGTSNVYIDGEMVMSTRVTTAKPLQFGQGYQGANLPAALKKGYAAVIIDQSWRFDSLAADLSLYPAK
jgi:hypothetical protein